MTDVELSILLTDDDAIHELNRTWRGKDRSTDVLSFSQVEGGGPGTPPLPPRTHDPTRPRRGRKRESPPLALGDVVISTETAAAQAARAGEELDAEMRRLLVHGILHLLGHDHVRGGAQARRMKAEERRLLALLAKGRAAEAGTRPARKTTTARTREPGMSPPRKTTTAGTRPARKTTTARTRTAGTRPARKAATAPVRRAGKDPRAGM